VAFVTRRISFNHEDSFFLDQQLSQDERMIRDAANSFCQENLAPRVLEGFRDETADPTIFKEMGELGLLGATTPEQYGGAGLNYVSYGLIAREVERVDSGYRSMMSVQSSLVMLPIYKFGSEDTRKKYLPKLASGECIGCFHRVFTARMSTLKKTALSCCLMRLRSGKRLSGNLRWYSWCC
jgi:glutaryl-CoA dehydrogenase